MRCGRSPAAPGGKLVPGGPASAGDAAPAAHHAEADDAAEREQDDDDGEGEAKRPRVRPFFVELVLLGLDLRLEVGVLRLERLFGLELVEDLRLQRVLLLDELAEQLGGGGDVRVLRAVARHLRVHAADDEAPLVADVRAAAPHPLPP